MFLLYKHMGDAEISLFSLINWWHTRSLFHTYFRTVFNRRSISTGRNFNCHSRKGAKERKKKRKKRRKKAGKTQTLFSNKIKWQKERKERKERKKRKTKERNKKWTTHTPFPNKSTLHDLLVSLKNRIKIKI